MRLRAKRAKIFELFDESNVKIRIRARSAQNFAVFCHFHVNLDGRIRPARGARKNSWFLVSVSRMSVGLNRVIEAITPRNFWYLRPWWHPTSWLVGKGYEPLLYRMWHQTGYTLKTSGSNLDHAGWSICSLWCKTLSEIRNLPWSILYWRQKMIVLPLYSNETDNYESDISIRRHVGLCEGGMKTYCHSAIFNALQYIMNSICGNLPCKFSNTVSRSQLRTHRPLTTLNLGELVDRLRKRFLFIISFHFRKNVGLCPRYEYSKFKAGRSLAIFTPGKLELLLLDQVWLWCHTNLLKEWFAFSEGFYG